MVQPRKTTTYGKSSRRPIPAISAFAEASEPATKYGQQENDTRRESGLKTTDERIPRLSGSFKELPPGQKTRSTKTTRRAEPKMVEAPNSCRTYERSSEEEVYVGDSSGENTGARKKRRLTPIVDVPLVTKTFDKNRLPNHTATKSRGSSRIKNSIAPREAKILPENTQLDSKNLQSEKTLDIDDRTPKSTIAHVSTSADLSKKRQPQVLDSGTRARYRIQDEQRALSNVPTPKVLSEEESGRRSRRLSTTTAGTPKSQNQLPSQAPGRDEFQRSQREDDFLLRTPPKMPKIPSGATTPKQQELWHKVLASDSGTVSCTPVDLYLHRTNREDQRQSEMIHSSMPENDELNATYKSGKRSVKLIDFLTSSTKDCPTSDDDCSEGRGSSLIERSKSIQSDASTKDEMITSQTPPSIENRSNRRNHIQDSVSAPAHQIVPSIKGVPKVTYIRERTHLEESDLTNASILEIPPVTGTGILRGRQRRGSGELQPEDRLMNSASQSLGEIEDSHGGPMRSIHELREAGGNTRVAGELDATLGDLEELVGSSNAARRSSLLRLASKLLEASTCRMFIDQGLEVRFLAQLNISHDIIERSLLAASLLQILFNTTSAVFLSQINHLKITKLLVGLLDKTGDLSSQVKLRETNMSKLAQTDFISYCGAFLKMPVWRIFKPPVLSGQVLALQCLDLFVRQAQDAACWSAIPSISTLSVIAETSIPLPGTKYPQGPCSNSCLELAVSILEASTRGKRPLNADVEWTAEALERISKVFHLLTEGLIPENSSLHSLTLRLYLNLTNTSPQLCETFSKCQILSAGCRSIIRQFDLLLTLDQQQQDPYVLEILVLSLGFMINLAEFSDTMRVMIMELETGEQKLLDILLKAFLKRKKAAEAYSEAEAEVNVAFGYLSILLSYVCLNGTVRSYINSRVEGPNLNALLDALEEFLKLHKQIDDGLQGGKGGTDRKANFVGRLQVLADELRTSA